MSPEKSGYDPTNHKSVVGTFMLINDVIDAMVLAEEKLAWGEDETAFRLIQRASWLLKKIPTEYQKEVFGEDTSKHGPIWLNLDDDLRPRSKTKNIKE